MMNSAMNKPFYNAAQTIAYALLIIGILMLFLPNIFRHLLGGIGVWIIIVLGIIFLLVGGVLLMNFASKAPAKEEHRLKREGARMRVSVDDIQIIQRSQIVHIPATRGRYTWTEAKDIEQIWSDVIYNDKETGNSFRTSVQMDKMSLSIRLRSRGYVDIYVDRKKRGVYWIDLGF